MKHTHTTQRERTYIPGKHTEKSDRERVLDLLYKRITFRQKPEPQYVPQCVGVQVQVRIYRKYLGHIRMRAFLFPKYFLTGLNKKPSGKMAPKGFDQKSIFKNNDLKKLGLCEVVFEQTPSRTRGEQ